MSPPKPHPDVRTIRDTRDVCGYEIEAGTRLYNVTSKGKYYSGWHSMMGGTIIVEVPKEDCVLEEDYKYHILRSEPQSLADLLTQCGYPKMAKKGKFVPAAVTYTGIIPIVVELIQRNEDTWDFQLKDATQAEILDVLSDGIDTVCASVEDFQENFGSLLPFFEDFKDIANQQKQEKLAKLEAQVAKLKAELKSTQKAPSTKKASTKKLK